METLGKISSYKDYFHFVSMKYIGFIPAEKGCPGSADGGHYQLLDCIYNRSLRWSTIVHILQIFGKRFFSSSNFAVEQDPCLKLKKHRDLQFKFQMNFLIISFFHFSLLIFGQI